jgi:hypothetical protein
MQHPFYLRWFLIGPNATYALPEASMELARRQGIWKKKAWNLEFRHQAASLLE